MVADALSRKTNLLVRLDISVLGLDEIKDLYATDAFFGDIFAKCSENKGVADFYLHKGNKLCIPESSLRLLILKESHGGALMGHFGRDKTFAHSICTVVGYIYGLCVRITTHQDKQGFHLCGSG